LFWLFFVLVLVLVLLLVLVLVLLLLLVLVLVLVLDRWSNCVISLWSISPLWSFGLFW
jgi:hypothetical protein